MNSEAYQAVEKSPLAALLQKAQILAYAKRFQLRFGLELFLRLATVVFEQPATKDFFNTQVRQ